jgi:hypothetical protein
MLFRGNSSPAGQKTLHHSANCVRRGREGSNDPHLVHLEGPSNLRLAGMWKESDEWGAVYSGFMTNCNNFVAQVHDRMPVLLRRTRPVAAGLARRRPSFWLSMLHIGIDDDGPNAGALGKAKSIGLRSYTFLGLSYTPQIMPPSVAWRIYPPVPSPPRCKPARRIERAAHPTFAPKVMRKMMPPLRELCELPAPEYPLEIGARMPAPLPPCPRRHSPASLRQTRTAGMVAPSLPESRPFQRGATPCDRL